MLKMTRASTRDLAARLVWLLMDKCSFFSGELLLPLVVMGIGNGRRQHFTGRHITDPAEAARIMSREGFREERLPSRVIASGSQNSLDTMVTMLGGLTK